MTRLILTTATPAASCKAFGQFVVGGNVVVGLVIFLILVVIQFVVITNGAGRVAEVAARFTLDAMPGKQMAIDADLNAGLITDEQARARRAEIAQRGGLLRRDGRRLEVRQGRRDGGRADHRRSTSSAGSSSACSSTACRSREATQHYSLLTVGDGLAAQIPALLISVATGIIVTRSASERDLGSDIARQILRQRKAPMVAGGVICAFALVPGLPKLPFLFIGGDLRRDRLGGPQRRRRGRRAGRGRRGRAARAARSPRAASEDAVIKELPIDPLELGDRLRPRAARRPPQRRHAASAASR